MPLELEELQMNSVCRTPNVLVKQPVRLSGGASAASGALANMDRLQKIFTAVDSTTPQQMDRSQEYFERQNMVITAPTTATMHQMLDACM